MYRNFVHLHVHSGYSLLDGAILPETLVAKAKELEMPALAITDHGSMFGALEFYKKAKAEGIKPIIGCEVYVAPHDRTEKKQDAFGKFNYHLVLLAKNITGYRNLTKIVSDSYISGFYHRPRTDKSMLRKYSEGLIALSSCLGGEIPQMILRNDMIGAENLALEFREIYGDDFYLEVQQNGLPDQKIVNDGIFKIHQKTGISVVATNDIHFLNSEDYEAHKALIAIATKRKLSEMDAKDSFKLPESVYFKDQKTMAREFADHPEVIANTKVVADKCNLEIEMGKLYFPHFNVPQGETVDSYLEKLVFLGLEREYKNITDEIKERAKHELDIIKKMGFSSYFLIVWDFIKYAKDNNIDVGPGRGSAGGSIVAYALNITEIDPLKYGLFFERFLNPERKSMPDIDIDIVDDRREEVIEYVRKKYGEANVAQIATFGKMKARAVLRDVARVLEIPLSLADKIAKMVPLKGDNINLKSVYDSTPEFRKIINATSVNKKLFEISRKLENLPRHASKHAAGVVISDKDLSFFTPLFVDKEGNIVTQYDKKIVEEIGLLKMDFLGLKNLGVIRDTIAEVKRLEGIDIDIRKIPLDDKDTFKLLQAGRTVGIFQLEQRGMTQMLVDLVPTSIEDIIALLALYRPGPLNSGMAKQFIERKHGREKIEYLHPSLEPILKDTYGVIVYQEQVMQIAQVMSKFSLGQADEIRRAMGKKDAKKMQAQKKILLEGALKNGYSKEVADKIISSIEKFAKYGFNKSHSAAYAYISYQTAYLKTHYPEEFMAALLTNEMSLTEKLVKNRNEAKMLGIEVLPPDVNKSFEVFSVHRNSELNKKEIYFCLAAIKGVGGKAVENIIAERDKNGAYKDFLDFCKRIDLHAVNKKTFEALIKVGAFDSLDSNRAKLLANFEKVLDFVHKVKRNYNDNQILLFGKESAYDQLEMINTPPWSDEENWINEHSLLGFFVSSHPLTQYSSLLEHLDVSKCGEISDFPENKKIQLAGVITNLKFEMIKETIPKFSFLLEDFSGLVKIEIFNDQKAYTYNQKFRNHQVIYLEGEVVYFNDNFSHVKPSFILPIDKINPSHISAMYLTVSPLNLTEDELRGLRNKILEKRGKTKLYLKFVEPGSNDNSSNQNRTLEASSELDFSVNSELQSYIQERFGINSFKYKYDIKKGKE